MQGGSLTYLPGGKYNFICEPVDYSNSPEATKILRLGWWFLILKIAELLDTVCRHVSKWNILKLITRHMSRYSLFYARNSRTSQLFMSCITHLLHGASGSDWSLVLVVIMHSFLLSIVVSTWLCILITVWLHWDPVSGSISGGRSTWP